MTKQQTLIINMIDEAKKGYDLYATQFEALEAGYNNNIDEELLKSLRKRRKSHIAPKIIKAKVRKVVISVMKTYFETDEFAKILPASSSSDDIELYTKIQSLLNEWTTKKLNLYTRIKPSVIDGAIYGTPIVKVYWKDGEGLRLNRVKIKDLHLDPNATNHFDIQYCVHRVVTTIGKLRKQYGKKFKWKNFIGDYTDTQVSSIDLGDASRVEVRDVYRLQDGKWRVSTVLPNDSFIVTDKVLKDGLPFIIGNLEPQFVGVNELNSVESYGGSFIEGMMPLQEEYTITRNQQIDAIDRIFNPRYFATKTAGLKEEDVNSNRKKITVSNLKEVQELPVPNINQTIFGVDRLDGEMQEVSGITKYNQGMNDKANLNQTATGVSILTQEGNAVIEDIIRALNESFFEPMIARIVKLLYKYDTNVLLYDVDRSKRLLFSVSINTGVGAINSEIQLNNIQTAEGSAVQNFKLSMEVQDAERAKKYLEVLDELFKEKIKVLRLKTITSILNEEDTEDEPTDGRPTVGDGGVPTGLEAVPTEQGLPTPIQ